MTIFAIIAPEHNEKLKLAIRRVFDGKNFEFSQGQFVVAATGLTAAQVSELLGANGEIGQFVVFAIAAHWGYHRKDLWEWLSVNSAS